MKKEQINISNYPLGSQWRRWDLHVHTPESKLGSSFKGVSWEDYLDSLDKAAEESNIAVIGITDYMTIDGYEKIFNQLSRSDNRYLNSVKLIIPNIEFRALPSTRDGKALNIHLLIDPSDEDHISKIKCALNNLRVTYGGEPYSCTKESLIRFAKAQRSSFENDEQAYKYGIEQFKPSYNDIMNWIKSQKWLRDNCLIGIANGKDGISGLPLDGFSATRDELLKQSDFVFSGNKNDRNYYLGKTTSIEAIIGMYNGLKPCLHGSDAHEINKLFNPDEDRYCWIKADPTFEGLKQVLWEPEERVYIGQSHPQLPDENNIISEIKLNNHKGWFGTELIKLNPGLITIIGEKGTGKTAIADLISFASGISSESDSQSSFIEKGKPFLEGLEIQLTWGKDIKTNGKLLKECYKTARPLVRYLSQDFVERLCSEDYEGNELQKAIEDVVFSHLDEIEKQSYSSFEILRREREKASEARRDNLTAEIYRLNDSIQRMYIQIHEKDDKNSLLQQYKNQLESLIKQKDSILVDNSNNNFEEFQSKKEKYRILQAEISEYSNVKRNIEEFCRSYEELKREVSYKINQLVSNFRIDEQLTNHNILHPSWRDEPLYELQKQIGELESKIIKISGSEEFGNENTETLYKINQEIDALKDSISSNEIEKERLILLQAEIQKMTISIQQLEREINDLEVRLPGILNMQKEERNKNYFSYFQSLVDDENRLKELYKPIHQQLVELDMENKLTISTGYKIDYVYWLNTFFDFIDNRKINSSNIRQTVQEIVMSELVPAWEQSKIEDISNAICKLENTIFSIDFLKDYAVKNVNLTQILNWIYSADHITVTYRIEYNGIQLNHLSPGTRGIALLILYLLLDKDDVRPLIIDQPEGNLDNSSIYEQLVPYIRKAKANRQIILVTHNPNLVVTTDADQIIVAITERIEGQPYPRIYYVSGSLEHNENKHDMIGMRQLVCTLLEGGNQAFKNREGRYSI